MIHESSSGETKEKQLMEYDESVKKIITKAKRKKALKVEDGYAVFSVKTKFIIPSEMQTLLRALVNIEAHGKAWALDDGGEKYKAIHHRISYSYERELKVKFDLKTGEVTISVP